MKLDELIRTNLEAVANAVPSAEPLPVADIRRRGHRRRRNRRLALVVGISVLVIGTLYLVNPRAALEHAYVADGETLVSTEPAVVQGAESPEPRFDTADLGPEVSLTPISDFTNAVDRAKQLTEGIIIKITLLGTTPGGVNAMIIHSEQNDPDLGLLQVRCVATDLGAACSGNRIADLVDEPGGLMPSQPTGPVYVVGEEADLTWEVPANASVVMLSVNGERRWQRPVGGVAVFDAELFDGDRLQLTAFDATGNPIDDQRQIASSE